MVNVCCTRGSFVELPCLDGSSPYMMWVRRSDVVSFRRYFGNGEKSLLCLSDGKSYVVAKSVGELCGLLGVTEDRNDG